MNKTLGYIFQILNPVLETREPYTPWSEVVNTSQNEGLSFLLYKSAIKKNIDIPFSIKQSLKQEYIYNWGRNIRILEEMAALLRMFKNPVIVLKGAALLSSVYEDFGLRMLGDVDILVKPEDVPKIDKVLSQSGYKSDHTLNFYRVTNYLNSVVYGKTGSPLLLHLHWHLINNALPNYVYAEKIDMDKIWNEAIPLKVRLADVLCLAPHHQLLHLSEHAMKHSYNTLIHVWDIHLVINYWKEKLRWERLCSEAEEFQLKGPLFYSLWLSKEYFGICVPQEILEFLRPRHKGMGERFFFYLLRKGKRREKLCWLFYFSNISGWRKRVKFVFRTIFPPIDILSHMEADENKGNGNLSRKVALRRLLKALRLFGKVPQEYDD
ncbi:MAG TPA: nucleotidyltransferase domain-containing protein [Candidatus Wunengus sp. YC65]|uniref:nucleotidyltransferase domain-containing protein n=1 Tax=Candidatus Wunengus sp. YC65 TaxID=3367701 RepID=UPI004026A2F2